MLDLRLYMAQRITAMLMAPFVLVHLGVMIYAIQGGLSAAEILGRTQGSVLWFLFYGGFVIAVAIHASIGLRVIAHELLGLGQRALDAVMWGAGALLLTLGGWSVLAVTLGPGQ
ncbi:succinate dehydrogenase [Jannaschia ovalis]|uniref:Succinate dehydrogenase n=1 Tax=Jannaschia ovalis TaxID=3038773 RepID=A0ABY8LB92_9RHOB|nr:succinate dehydrogenase [Jannaschia sp. GRR-S6-38]WGH77315.1 succinate dehydrogenase [Jannaschia sp. GRR-S6-38]